MTGPVLVVHGGAGAFDPRDRPDELMLRAGLVAAVEAGWAALSTGALSAVLAAVEVLEAHPAFNAATGGVLALDGLVHCDAAVMTGDGRAGAVADLTTFAHPVRVAARLLHDHEPAFWVGHDDLLADRTSIEQVTPTSLVTDRQRERLARVGPHDEVERFGTVGAVCLDGFGEMAAATSTGGKLAKAAGRVGDSPVLGAGTWASEAVAVSCTGDGEAFMRAGAAHELDALVRLGGVPFPQACAMVLRRVYDLGGSGGLIAVHRDGGFVAAATTPMLLRAWRVEGGAVEVALDA
ncbi:MAG TPA: isoaspartyl peptidase/L-asparaginase [Acidimicrobiales bacterium]